MISVHENYRPRLFHLQGRTKPPINTTQQRKKKKKEKNTSGLLPSKYKKNKQKSWTRVLCQQKSYVAKALRFPGVLQRAVLISSKTTAN